MAGSTTGKNAILNGLVAAGHYISLHTGDPGTTGANEASGGSYARQSITWPSASGGTISYATAVAFPVAAGTYTHWGFRSALTGGTWIEGGPLSRAVVVPVATTVNITLLTLSVA